MKIQRDHLTDFLKKSWQVAAPESLQSNKDVKTLMNALFEGRFKFAKEPWYGQNGKVAEELLLRAWDEKGVAIHHVNALNAIVDEGDLISFNNFLVYKTLAKTPVSQHASLSINIFPSCAANKSFWDILETSIGPHQSHKIIFEILEHEKDYQIDHSLMQAALGKGYRFALDDFEGTPEDYKRLQDFAPYLSYVKLDGKLVREGLKDTRTLEKTIAMLEKNYPDLEIVAEYVSNWREARRLYEMGTSAVQGMNLARNFNPGFRPQ